MMEEAIVEAILRFYPTVEAIYLFGSYGTEEEWPSSDVDIALLLPPAQAKSVKNLIVSECRFALDDLLKKEVDLVNLRMVSTVFQFQIVTTGRLLYTGNSYAVDEFEMLTLSFYQKLNEERREILEEFYKTGRAYRV